MANNMPYRSSIIKENYYPLKHVVHFSFPSRPLVSFPPERTMTIAAGYVLEEGVVLCADTEWTYDQDKSPERKMFRRTTGCMDLRFAGSGDRAVIAVGIDILCDYLKDENNSLKGMALEGRMEHARKLTREKSIEVHERYVVPALQTTPNLQIPKLLIGIHSSEGGENEAHLLHVDFASLTVERITHYECIGYGGALGRQLSQILYDYYYPMDVMVPAALLILEEVKDKVPYCGGDTHVYRIPKKPEERRRQNVWDSKKIREEFEEDMRFIVSGARDMRLTDSEFESKLGSLTEKLRSIRAIVRANRPTETEAE